jgi:hypothetical protein
MNGKAQSPVLSYVLILGIVLASVSAAYLWGVPLLKKGEASSKVELAKNSMIQLKREVDSVISGGGQASFSINSYGTIMVSEEDNSIYYSLYVQRAPYALDVWIPLTSNEMFGVVGTEEENSTALLGLEEPSVLLVRVEKAGEGYLVTYRLALRELDDSNTAEGYLNKFTPVGNARVEQGRHAIVIRKGESTRGGVSKLKGELITQPIYVSIN